jgi:hypothetical protein
MEINDKKPLPCGLLSPAFDWPKEQRAVQPQPESNVIYLADYRPRN